MHSVIISIYQVTTQNRWVKERIKIFVTKPFLRYTVKRVKSGKHALFRLFSVGGYNPTWKRIPTSPMPILRIQPGSREWLLYRLCVVCLAFLPLPPHTGAIRLHSYSELHVTEGGTVSFLNNHADSWGGKYCHPCLLITVSSPRSLWLTSLFWSGCSEPSNLLYNFILSVAIILREANVFSTSTALRRSCPTRRNLEVRREERARIH